MKIRKNLTKRNETKRNETKRNETKRNNETNNLLHIYLYIRNKLSRKIEQTTNRNRTKIHCVTLIPLTSRTACYPIDAPLLV